MRTNGRGSHDSVYQRTERARAQLKKALPEIDRLIARKDGTFEARNLYFYRHGQTAEGFANSVCAGVRAAGMSVSVLDVTDHWAPWPRDSYFSVVIQVGGAEAGEEETK